MGKHRTLLIVVATALACTGTSSDAPSRSSAHSATGDTLTRQGVWSDSVTAQSEFVATYVNGSLRTIDEQMRFTDGMRSTRRYVYDVTSQPVLISEQRTLMVPSGNSSPTELRASAQLYLTGDRVDSTHKTVDGKQQTLQSYDIENLRQHERVIAARVSPTFIAP